MPPKNELRVAPLPNQMPLKSENSQVREKKLQTLPSTSRSTQPFGVEVVELGAYVLHKRC